MGLAKIQNSTAHSNLYKENNSHSSSFPEDVKEVPTLTEELRMVCEGKIEYNECFNFLQSFPKKNAWERWTNNRILFGFLVFDWETSSRLHQLLL